MGSVATVSVTSKGDAGQTFYGLALRNLAAPNPENSIQMASASTDPLSLSQLGSTATTGNLLGVNLNNLSSSFDILSFRIAEATQKWKEVT